MVLNTVLSNTGDAAIFEAIAHTLQLNSADPIEFTALDSAAAQASQLYPQWKIIQQPTRSTRGSRALRAASSRLRTTAVRIITRSAVARRAVFLLGARTDFVHALRQITEADIVLSSGGTYLVDHYNFGHRVAEIAFAHALKKRVFLWTQSLGPFATEQSRKLAEELVPLVDGVYFRDARSERAWQSVGPLPALSDVCADVVFSLYDPLKKQARRSEDQPLVLFSVRDWNQAVAGGDFSFESYAAAMRAAAEGFIAKGWRCQAVSTCQGVDGYAIDDSETARRIFGGLQMEINSDFHSPQELMAILRGADLVIATRMHMAIMSLITETPVIAIAYETKSTELFHSIGAPASVTAIEAVDDAWAAMVTGSDDPTATAARLDEKQLNALRANASKPAEAVALVSGLRK
ncbi:polysaccharide pyruvyl transferase family protein [Microbacterium sp. cx-59]|uniref:polysaccharide pyruvyl transferase family protein n=1 Tax=Microbacterium sp. cx-59 TaxID=2891207 RepID=UPI001E3C2681|nr:polysaccharide pyruvyl transferase family protein [Microbacterium sp. cx-59]MCC4908094.1 polysaccharide pyruvyl transferase family protein [Microbacterium sp. cx-59]